MAQLMPLPLTVSCFSKIQIGSTFLVLPHLGSPGKRAIKRVCVCVCVHVRVRVRVCVCVASARQHWDNWRQCADWCTYNQSVLGLAFLRLARVFTESVLPADFGRLGRRHRRSVRNVQRLKHQHAIIYFASAAVAVDSSHMTASSSASWSRFCPHLQILLTGPYRGGSGAMMLRHMEANRVHPTTKINPKWRNFWILGVTVTRKWLTQTVGILTF